jgi:hypothetical protein
MTLTAAAVCLTAYLPHVIAVGVRVVGYLPGYLKEEHYGSGARFLLLGALPWPARSVTAVAVTVLGIAAISVGRARLEPAVGSAVLLAVALLIATPVQPWYAVALAGVGLIAGAPWSIAPVLGAEIYYAAVVLNHSHQVAIGRLGYGASLLTMTVALVIARPAALSPPPPGPVEVALGRSRRTLGKG